MADLPVLAFIQERLSETDTTLETRKGTAFYDLFIKPQQFMLQPLITAMETVLTGQSVNRILALSDPDTFDSGLVDDLVSNVYVTRDPGNLATTTVRVLYQTAVDREYAALTAEFASNGLSFFNTNDIVISAAQMQLQVAGNFFYLDVPVQAQNPGTQYNLTSDQGVTFVNDTAAVSTFFLSNADSGLSQETNTQLLSRAKNSIGVRDLETVKGINAIIQENFPYVTEVQAIGMGDPEMQRDILYNAHVGSKTDVYLKTPAFQTLSSSFIGVEYDTTRNLPNNIYMQITATSFSDPTASLNTPFIVSETVSVKSNVVPTAANCVTVHVPAGTGINLSAGQWIKLQVDNEVPVNIKIAGANPLQTQRFEIINAINAAIGFTIATEYATDQIFLESPTVGAGSQLIFYQPDTPRSDGTLALVPSVGTIPPANTAYAPPVAGSFLGVAPIVYLENIDYQVDYTNGKIINLLGGILSGRVIAEHPGTPDAGAGIITTGSSVLSTAVVNAFSLVQPGDTIIIDASTGVALGEYVVTSKANNQTLTLLDFIPTGNDTAVQYHVTSNQVVIVAYEYNPLSIDIGTNVLFSDGLTRGIRPGRDSFTIKDAAFVDIISVQEIDPVTNQGLGIFLNGPGGFGSGGFGEGSFGIGGAGDYQFIVNSPTERFSAFEDSVMVFNPQYFGQSFQVTYLAATEIASIHNFCRNDTERVTGADVLPKTFIPGLVDMTITVRPDPTNLNTPSNATLVQSIGTYIKSVKAGDAIDQSQIEKLLNDQGLLSVQNPFTMTATVLNPDGSSTIITSEDQLSFPSVTLDSQTNNFTTGRIVQWYPNNIVINGVS